MFDASRYHTHVAEAIPHPLLFASVSGAHLYGFPSPDSDIDLRSCHVLPAEPDMAAVEALVVDLQGRAPGDARFVSVDER